MQPELRVLIVDEFKEWRCLVASRLRKEYQIESLEEASDGIEALNKAKELQPELILLDVGLPRLNGLEVARRILQAAPKTRIIFLSENRSCEIAEEALRIGAAAYVVKAEAAPALLPAMHAAPGRQRLVASQVHPNGSADYVSSESDAIFKSTKSKEASIEDEKDRDGIQPKRHLAR